MNFFIFALQLLLYWECPIFHIVDMTVWYLILWKTHTSVGLSHKFSEPDSSVYFDIVWGKATTQSNDSSHIYSRSQRWLTLTSDHIARPGCNRSSSHQDGLLTLHLTLSVSVCVMNCLQCRSQLQADFTSVKWRRITTQYSTQYMFTYCLVLCWACLGVCALSGCFVRGAALRCVHRHMSSWKCTCKLLLITTLCGWNTFIMIVGKATPI